MNKHLYDLIIIGAGPAGLNASVYASRAGLDVLLIEAMVAGGKLYQTETVENWLGEISIAGHELATKMHQHALAFGAKEVYAQVTELVKLEEHFLVKTHTDTYQAKTVLLATGTTEKKLGIPGELEYYGRGVSYCAVCDAAFYQDKTVAVIGGGNSAFEEADYLSRFAQQVHLILRRDEARAEQINQDKIANNPKVIRHNSFKPLEILGNEKTVTGVKLSSTKDALAEDFNLAIDGIFPLIGNIPQTQLIAGLATLDENGYVITDANRATSTAGLYAAGDICQKNLSQIITAASDGAIAAQAIATYLR